MNETNVVADGSVLVVKSLEADNIDYYDVVDITKNTFVGQIQVMSANENITECVNGKLTAQAVVGTKTPITVVAAIYEGGKLIKASSGKLSQSGVLSTDITVDDATKQNLKVFVWDSVLGMKALTDVHAIGTAQK